MGCHPLRLLPSFPAFSKVRKPCLPLPYTTPYTFFHRWLVPFFEMRTKNEMKFDNQTKKGVVETFDSLSSLSSKT
jgi:hypothetical protein